MVGFCKQYQDSLQIDTSNIALFGHSMGGWVLSKSFARTSKCQKGFALSTWNIYDDFKNIKDTAQLIV